MPILVEGELFVYVKGVFGSKKTKRYGVLHGRSADSHPYMELFDKEEDRKHAKRKGDYKNIDLHFIKAITNQVQNSSKGMEYHMEIRTKKEKVVILFDSEEDSSGWSSKLNGLVNGSEKHEDTSVSSMIETGDSENDEDECVTLNEMYGGTVDVQRFEVEVQSTDLAKLCEIEGHHTLLVSESSLAFESPQTKRIVNTFQLSWLRRFGKKETVFSFEVGRQSPNGAGDIKLTTDSAKFIHDLVKNKSNSRGTTVTPAPSKGITAAQNNIKTVLEKKLEPTAVQDGISAPALHVPKRHPGLSAGPALVPIKRETAPEEISPVSNRDSSKRVSGKSLNGESATGKLSGSGKHGTASENFAKQIENTIIDHKESTKIKDKDRDSKRKEKEEKENKKKEEKREKERKEKEKKEEKKQKEKAKKEEKKYKEKSQMPLKPIPKATGLYEEVDLVDPSTPSPNSQPKFPQHHDNYSEPSSQDDDLYDHAASLNPEGPVEYAQPMTRKQDSFRPTEYSDVQLVKGNAWKMRGRSEDEEVHSEDYQQIKSVRDELMNPPPLPGRMYDDNEGDDETYNTVDLTAPKPRGTKQHVTMETQNIYGTASETKVGPIQKGVALPDPDYSETDSGESYTEDTYDKPDFDTYDQPNNVISQKKNDNNSYEEADPQPSVRRKVAEESLYDEVS